MCVCVCVCVFLLNIFFLSVSIETFFIDGFVKVRFVVVASKQKHVRPKGIGIKV